MNITQAAHRCGLIEKVLLSDTIRFATRRSPHLLAEALGGHQSYGTSAGTDIKKSAICRSERHGSTEQNAVGIYLHGATLIYYIEPLESEYLHGPKFSAAVKILIYSYLSHSG
jgi:hypothetical protein